MAVPLLIGKASIVGPPLVIAGILVIQETIQPVGTRMDPTLFAAAIVTVLSSLGGLAVLVINALSASRDRRDAAVERRILLEKSTATVDKADQLIKSTAEIHTLANSTNSNLQKTLEVMTERNAAQEQQIREMEREKAETAATRATTDQQISSALRTPVPEAQTSEAQTPIAEVLKKVEVNTAQTAKNTSKEKS